MIAPSIDLATWLATPPQSVGTLGTDIFVGTEPGAPDDCVTLYDTGGLPPSTDELDLFYPAIQVRARSKTYANAYAKLTAIKDALTQGERFTTANSIFVSVAVQTDVISLGMDDNDRYMLVQNFTAIRKG